MRGRLGIVLHRPDGRKWLSGDRFTVSTFIMLFYYN